MVDFPPPPSSQGWYQNDNNAWSKQFLHFRYSQKPTTGGGRKGRS